MTNPQGTEVDVAALTKYAGDLGFYHSEADKFGAKIDTADVTNEAWGLVGIWAKKSYSDRLTELRDLLDLMKEGVDALTDKMTQTAEVYQGNEEDKTMMFGQHEAMLDGPK